MATLTSTGAVNLTSATNWSPEQIPTTGDDLVIGAHVLTLDASMTLNTVTFTHSASRVGFVAGTFEITADNGWHRNHVSFTSGTLGNNSVVAGMDYTFAGTWYGTWTSTQSTFMWTITGGTVRMRTKNNNPSDLLIDLSTATTTRGWMIATGNGGSLFTLGRFDMSQSPATGSYLVSLSGSFYWKHESVGLNRLGTGGSWALLTTNTATTDIDWSGDLETTISTSGTTSIAVFNKQGPGTVNFSGNITLHGGTVGTGVVAIFWMGSTSVLNLTGKAVTTDIRTHVWYTAVATPWFNWTNQTHTITENERVGIFNGGIANLEGLVLSVAGSFGYYGLGSNTVLVDSTTQVTGTIPSADLAAYNAVALFPKLLRLPVGYPALPPVTSVAAGTTYGYAGSLLTGTGLIVNPSVIETAVENVVNPIEDSILEQVGDTLRLNAVEDNIASVTRAIDNLDPIQFSHSDSAVTFSAYVTINNGEEVACQGVVTSVVNGLPGNWYQLSYVAADRPVNGHATYRFNDGTADIYVLLTVTQSTNLDPVLAHLPEVGRAATAEQVQTVVEASEIDLQPVLDHLPEVGRAATPADVSPTIEFNPTIEPTPVTVNPTELSAENIATIAEQVSSKLVKGQPRII